MDATFNGPNRGKIIDSSQIIVLADDYTGANDSGVQFKKYGLSAITIIDKDYLDKMLTYDVIVIDNETRKLNKIMAYQKTEEIAKLIVKYYKNGIIYKKIDSTLRGNITPEIKALVDILDPEIVVFAPAYPKNNRKTIDGIQYLGDIPLDMTELVKDPITPVNTGNINHILNKYEDMKFVHININTIRSKTINQIVNDNNYKYLSFDSETDDDLDEIANAIISSNKKALWVGSAGLADAIMRQLAPNIITYKPILAVVGSINSISAAQTRMALLDNNISGIKLSIDQIFYNPEMEINRILSDVEESINNKKDIVLASAVENDQIITASYLNQKLGLSLSEVSSYISNFIGEVVYKLFCYFKFSGLFLTGGDTAFNVIKKIGANGAVIEKEIENGIPAIRVISGPFVDLIIITKAGGFGDEYTILNSINYLRKTYNQIL